MELTNFLGPVIVAGDEVEVEKDVVGAGGVGAGGESDGQSVTVEVSVKGKVGGGVVAEDTG